MSLIDASEGLVHYLGRCIEVGLRTLFETKHLYQGVVIARDLAEEENLIQEVTHEQQATLRVLWKENLEAKRWYCPQGLNPVRLKSETPPVAYQSPATVMLYCKKSDRREPFHRVGSDQNVEPWAFACLHYWSTYN